MDEITSYPPIEPSHFDLIVIGTGLPESIIASAASAAGKAVLHLDPNPFYGTHCSSLPLDDFISFLRSHSESSPQPPLQNCDHVPLTTRPLYSELEINSYSSEPLESSRKFSIDLVAPRVFFCADAMIDLAMKTGINQYMEFKSVDASFVSGSGSKLENVPNSRSAIFKNRSLSLTEKNQLMKFFKLVQGHFGGEEKIPEEDLESPFVEFLTKMGLSQKLKSIILYTIALADYDQEKLEMCKNVITTKSGINHLELYHSSIGRFTNASGAIIYPIYGQGELTQAFCRRAAVKGCIYVLRMPVIALLTDKDGRTYQGVRLASGQELSSTQLILAPSFAIPPTSPPAAEMTNSYDVSPSDTKRKVARGICITNKSVNPEVANCLVFFPPRTLCPEQITSVRVLQLSSNVGVCPSEMFVTYLSAVCDDALEGKKLLNAALNVLFSKAVSLESENNGIDNLHDHPEEKPYLLWSTLYIQELTMFHGAFNSIRFTPMPDEYLHYVDILDKTEKLFKEIYPNEEFFPTTTASEKHADAELDP